MVLIIPVHLGILAGILFLLEIFYFGKGNDVEIGKNKYKVITLAKFENKISRGKKLVLIDDLILDVGTFMYNHPGGRFVLEQYIGRNIGKLFWGGYTLESD